MAKVIINLNGNSKTLGLKSRSFKWSSYSWNQRNLHFIWQECWWVCLNKRARHYS